jgi:hypothetical protein
MSSPDFSGPDRRHHKLFVTRNTEYHVRDGRVIAVRERARRRWLPEHKAIGLYVQGRVHGDTMMPQPEQPGVGDRIYFADGLLKGPTDLVTSTVLAVERPQLEDVSEYATLAAA